MFEKINVDNNKERFKRDSGKTIIDQHTCSSANCQNIAESNSKWCETCQLKTASVKGPSVKTPLHQTQLQPPTHVNISTDKFRMSLFKNF